MLFPIGDDNRDRHLIPFVNYVFIALNIFVFIYWQDIGRNIHFTFAYSAVPAEILSGQDIVTEAKMLRDPYTGQMVEMPGLQPTYIPVYLTLFTSMFMHGGIAHLAGNLMYLWIFGDNLENVMGHRNYLFFYLLCGLLASLSHVFSTVYFDQNTIIPCLGASGAISGVLGGYLLLFPGRSVHVWLFLGIVSLPAFLVVGLWFVFQVINGMGILGGEEAGGIAYAAHIGGFIAGLILVSFFVRHRPQADRYYQRKKRSFW
jgi:membrane associated rhomboid family serine protease